MVKNPPFNAGDKRDASLSLGSGIFPGRGHGTDFSILAWRIPMDRGAWRATVHTVSKPDMTEATKHTEAHKVEF